MIYISYPQGKTRNFVAKEEDCGGHYYTESRAQALSFSTDGVALAYVAQYPWLKDMFAKDLIKLVPG